MKKLRWILLGFLALAPVSCKMVEQISDTASELLEGDLVARVGNHRLHRKELENYIPSGVSPEDSAALAERYINAWAENLLLLDMAEEQLSEQEKDVSEELEQYRRILLKYRYEQLYINQRLDTLITDAELERFYKEHPDKFLLERAVVKARYMIIPADSRNLKTLRKKMSSDDDAEVLEVDSLAFTTAIKYADSSDTWMDVLTLAQELGTDYPTLMASVKNSFAEVKDDAGNLKIAYIVEQVPAGNPAPLEFCADRARDIILSSRKRELETRLEQDLLKDALRNRKFVIY